MTNIRDNTTWEYKQFTFEDWKPQQRWASLATNNRFQDYHGAVMARQCFWEQAQPTITQQLQRWLDVGWEPIDIIGPDAIELQKTETIKTQFGLEDFFVCVLTLGVALLIPGMFDDMKKRYVSYSPKRLSISMRRAASKNETISGQTNIWHFG